MTINREIIKQYIAGGLPDAQIHSIRQNDQDAALFLDILDACLKKTKPHLKKHKTLNTLNQDDIELLLLRLLTFNIKKRDASTFLHQLYHNDKFFDHLQPSLSVAATPYPGNDEILKGITLQSEQKVFAYLAGNAHKEAKPRVPWLKTLWDRLMKYIPTDSGGFRLPALAIAAIFMFILVGRALWQNPAGTDIYKTYFGSETAYTSRQLSIQLPTNWTSDLRGGAPAISPNAGLKQQLEKTSRQLAAISKKIDIAKDYYREKDFSDALKSLNGVEPLFLALNASPKIDSLRAQLFFYYGMSHLGLTHNVLTCKAHIRKAIDHFKRADKILAEQSGAKHQDEIAFFLGYAYTLAGDDQNAISVLSTISKESNFYQQSQILISNL